MGAVGAIGLAWLGEDLLLLSVSAATGWIETAGRIEAGLMGSELVRLAMAGRIAIAADRVIVQDRSACGDPALDMALDSLAKARRAVRPRSWVGRPRPGICDAYLARLEAAGVVRMERDTRLGIFPVIRWRIADPARVAHARQGWTRSRGHAGRSRPLRPPSAGSRTRSALAGCRIAAGITGKRVSG